MADYSYLKWVSGDTQPKEATPEEVAMMRQELLEMRKYAEQAKNEAMQQRNTWQDWRQQEGTLYKEDALLWLKEAMNKASPKQEVKKDDGWDK